MTMHTSHRLPRCSAQRAQRALRPRRAEKFTQLRWLFWTLKAKRFYQLERLRALQRKHAAALIRRDQILQELQQAGCAQPRSSSGSWRRLPSRLASLAGKMMLLLALLCVRDVLRLIRYLLVPRRK